MEKFKDYPKIQDSFFVFPSKAHVHDPQAIWSDPFPASEDKYFYVIDVFVEIFFIDKFFCLIDLLRHIILEHAVECYLKCS